MTTAEMLPRILLVTHDSRLLATRLAVLHSAGYAVEVSTSDDEAFSMIEKTTLISW